MAILRLNRVTVSTDYVNNILTRAGNGALFLFYSGAPPNDASMAATGTLLGTLTLGSTTALGTVTTGVSNGAAPVLTFNLPPQANGVATGTPGYVRVASSSSVGVIDLDVTASGGGGSVIMTPDTITSGAPFSITSGSVTGP